MPNQLDKSQEESYIPLNIVTLTPHIESEEQQ